MTTLLRSPPGSALPHRDPDGAPDRRLDRLAKQVLLDVSGGCGPAPTARERDVEVLRVMCRGLQAPRDQLLHTFAGPLR